MPSGTSLDFRSCEAQSRRSVAGPALLSILKRQQLKVLVAFAAALLAAAPAFGVTIVYTTSLSGPNENPVNASFGIGVGAVTVDTTAHTLRVQQTFSGLTANTTASHIHGCAAPPTNAGVAIQQGGDA